MADSISIKDVVTIGSSVGAPLLASSVGSSIPGAGAAITSITSVLGAVDAGGVGGLLDLATGIYDSFFYHVLYDFINTPTMMPIWICYIGSEGLIPTVNAFKTLDEHGNGKHSSIDLQGVVNIFSAQRPLLPVGTIGMGVFLCQGVLTPSDSLSVKRDNYNAPIGGFLPGLITDTRELSEVSISFLENNASFVDFVLRPWMVQNSYQGMPFAKKANITIEQFTKTTKNGPLLLRKRFTLCNAFPTQIDSEKLQYKESTNDTRQIQFAYESYKMHGGMGGFDVTTILTRLAQIALSFAQNSGYKAVAPREDQKDINDLIKIITNGRVDPQTAATQASQDAVPVSISRSVEDPSRIAKKSTLNISITPEDVISQTNRTTVLRSKKVRNNQQDVPDTQQIKTNFNNILPEEADVVDIFEHARISNNTIKTNPLDNITTEVNIENTTVLPTSNDITRNPAIPINEINVREQDTPTIRDVVSTVVTVNDRDVIAEVNTVSVSIPEGPVPSTVTVANAKIISTNDSVGGEQLVDLNLNIKNKTLTEPDTVDSLTISSIPVILQRGNIPSQEATSKAKTQVVSDQDTILATTVPVQKILIDRNDTPSVNTVTAKKKTVSKTDIPITVNIRGEVKTIPTDTADFNKVQSNNTPIKADSIIPNNVKTQSISIPKGAATSQNIQTNQIALNEEDIIPPGSGLSSHTARKIQSNDSPLYVPYGKGDPLRRIPTADIPSTLSIPVTIKPVKS